MNREHRKIVHDLAEVYGVESVSYDSEPKRNVVITAQKWDLFIYFLFKFNLLCNEITATDVRCFVQGEVGLSQLHADVTDRKGNGFQGPSPHRSHQTAQQQVSRSHSYLDPYTTVCHNRQRPLTDALISSGLLQGHQWNLLVQDGERGARRRLFWRHGLKKKQKKTRR